MLQIAHGAEQALVAQKLLLVGGLTDILGQQGNTCECPRVGICRASGWQDCAGRCPPMVLGNVETSESLTAG
jgi:hypothetical protein